MINIFLMYVLLPPLSLTVTFNWFLCSHTPLPLVSYQHKSGKSTSRKDTTTALRTCAKIMADRYIPGPAVVHSLIYSKTLEINQVSKNSGMVKVGKTHRSDRPQCNYYKCSQRMLDMGKIHNYLLKQVDDNEVASHAGDRF